MHILFINVRLNYYDRKDVINFGIERRKKMKKMWLKKTLSVMLAASMVLSLSACGGKTEGNGNNNGNQGQSDSGSTASGAAHYFRADYLGTLPEQFKKNGGNYTSFYGDKLFYSCYNDDYTKQTICSFDVLTGEETVYLEMDQGGNGGDVFAENSYMNQFTADEEGNIYVLVSSSKIDENTVDKEKYANATKEDLINYIYNNWGYDTYEAAEEYVNNNESEVLPEGYSYGDLLLMYEATEANYIRKSYLKKYDTTGTEAFKAEIAMNSSNGYCDAMGMDADGNLYLAIEEWSEESSSSYIMVYDKDGAELGKIDIGSNYVSRLIKTVDGKCGYLTWSATGNGYSLCVLDPATKSVGEEIQMGSGYINSCIILDDHTYLYSSDRGLFKYDTATQETENYLNWMDCNISSNNVSAFGMLSDGRVAVYVQSWTSNGSNNDIAILSEISEEEAKAVSQINVACFYMDYNMENSAIEFNKKHTDYHINITQYYDYDSDVEYQDALDAFMTAIVSDTSIDVVCFNDYSQMLNFAAKGLLIDLKDVLASDADLSVDKILPNVINACTYDDKLVALPNNFSVTTLVGKVSDVGTTPGWTVADMKALYESKEPGTQILSWATKEEMFNTCISLGYNQFIDLENKTCNFNCDEFVNVLEFVSYFPDEYNYNDDTDITELMNQGKVLLYQTSLPDFGQMQMLSTIFADDLTYIGYPTSSGNGTMMYLSNLTGITKYCENADLAWEFLRDMYLPSDDYYYGGGYYSGSILKSEFDKFFDDATNPENYQGSWGWGNFETTLHAPSQEEVDQVKNIILESTAVNGAVSSGILNIIKEEAAAYFSGQKTAQDVAAIIQSRMEIYLSETM